MNRKAIAGIMVVLILMNSVSAVSVNAVAGIGRVADLIGKVCDMGKYTAYLKGLTSILGESLKRFILFLVMYVKIEDDDIFYKNVRESIMSNPSLSPGVENILRIFIGMLQPIYVLAIILTAFYLLFMQSSIGGRVRAKSFLSTLIISMIVVSMSIDIIRLLIAISEDITERILGLVDLTLIEKILHDGIYGSWCLMTTSGILHSELALLFYMILFSMGIWSAYLVIGLRHLVLVLFFMLFPVSISLYSFGFSRSIGRRWLELTLLFLFMQSLMAVTLLPISLGVHITDIKGIKNPEMNCLPTLVPQLASIFGLLGEGKTSVISFILGVVSHILIIITPLMMLRWMKNFLP